MSASYFPMCHTYALVSSLLLVADSNSIRFAVLFSQISMWLQPLVIDLLTVLDLFTALFQPFLGILVFLLLVFPSLLLPSAMCQGPLTHL